MTTPSYAEQLRDPRWQRVRLRVFERADFRCQMCGDKRRTLEVHHSFYERRKMAWEYPLPSLICVCHLCHAAITTVLRQRRAQRPPEGAQTNARPVRVEAGKLAPEVARTRFAAMREAIGTTEGGGR